MFRWTGIMAAALSFVVLAACGADSVNPSRPEPTTCPEDCQYGGYCGDGVCSGPETSSNCSRDCTGGGGCFTSEP
ncbi:hypothetical protein LZ198_31085 [Myxococcus sp. K15C18031901]|uniref:hypothetical protein n=1 Tax=Myxococcus dinghuensis TaxID=2906761 RepID=UPI0020A824EE|nr:hypothetical protein [Myxococcus dinghuensis]MCP3103336.1 hypothetical protein [Myxococcus dinghuensis]